MGATVNSVGTVVTGTTSLVDVGGAPEWWFQQPLLFVANKYPSNVPTQPTGYTQRAQASGGAGSAGADSGTLTVTCFSRDAKTTRAESAFNSGVLAPVTVATPSSNSAAGLHVCLGLERGDEVRGGGFDIAYASGSDNSAGTAFSVTAGSDPGLRAGDLVVVFAATNTDARTYASQALTATGITAILLTPEDLDQAITDGDDMRLVVVRFLVTAGISSAAPVFAMTASGTTANQNGGAAIFVRVREVPAPPRAGATRLYLTNDAASSPFPTTSPLLKTTPNNSEVTLANGEHDNTFPGTSRAGQWNPGISIGDTTAATEIDSSGSSPSNTRRGFLYALTVGHVWQPRLSNRSFLEGRLKIKANQGSGQSGKVFGRAQIVTGSSGTYVTVLQLGDTSGMTLANGGSLSAGQAGWSPWGETIAPVTSGLNDDDTGAADVTYAGTVEGADWYTPVAGHVNSSGQALLLELGFGEAENGTDRTWALGYNTDQSWIELGYVGPPTPLTVALDDIATANVVNLWKWWDLHESTERWNDEYDYGNPANGYAQFRQSNAGLRPTATTAPSGALAFEFAGSTPPTFSSAIGAAVVGGYTSYAEAGGNGTYTNSNGTYPNLANATTAPPDSTWPSGETVPDYDGSGVGDSLSHAAFSAMPTYSATHRSLLAFNFQFDVTQLSGSGYAWVFEDGGGGRVYFDAGGTMHSSVGIDSLDDGYFDGVRHSFLAYWNGTVTTIEIDGVVQGTDSADFAATWKTDSNRWGERDGTGTYGSTGKIGTICMGYRTSGNWTSDELQAIRDTLDAVDGGGAAGQEVSTSADINFAADEATVAFGFCPGTSTDGTVLLLKTSGGVTTASITIANNVLTANGFHGTGAVSGTLVAATWYAVVAMFRSGDTQLWIDSTMVDDSSSGATAANINATAQFQIGPPTDGSFEITRLHIISHADNFSSGVAEDISDVLATYLEESGAEGVGAIVPTPMLLSASGKVTMRGVASLVPTLMLFSAVGKESIRGVGDARPTRAAVSASGWGEITGSGAIVPTPAAVSAIAAERTRGASALAPTSPLVDAVARQAMRGAASVVPTPLHIAASGWGEITGTASIVVSNPSVAASALERMSGASQIVPTPAIVSAVGWGEITGAASIVVTSVAISASGVLRMRGTSALAITPATVTASAVQRFAATCAIVPTALLCSAQGWAEITGSAAIIVLPTMAAVGLMLSPITGACEMSIHPSVSAQAVERFRGSSELAPQSLTVDALALYGARGNATIAPTPIAIAAAGVERMRGVGAITTSPTLSASGGQRIAGVATLAIPSTLIAAIAREAFRGVSASEPTRPAISASAIEAFRGVGTVVIAPVIDASGTALLGVTGTSEISPTSMRVSAAALMGVRGQAAIVPTGTFISAQALFGNVSSGQLTWQAHVATRLIVTLRKSTELTHRTFVAAKLIVRLPMGPFHVGDVVDIPIECKIRNATTGLYALADPTTISIKVRAPNGNETTYAYGTDSNMSRQELGKYLAKITVTAAGRWDFVWSSPGPTAQGTEPGYFDVEATI